MQEGKKAKLLLCKILSDISNLSPVMEDPGKLERMFSHRSLSPFLQTMYHFLKALQAYTRIENELKDDLFSTFKLHKDDNYNIYRKDLAEKTQQAEAAFGEFIAGLQGNPIKYLREQQKVQTPSSTQTQQFKALPEKEKYKDILSAYRLAQLRAKTHIVMLEGWDKTDGQWLKTSPDTLTDLVRDLLIAPATHWDPRQNLSETALELKWFIAELRNPNHEPTTKIFIHDCQYASYYHCDMSKYRNERKRGKLIIHFSYANAKSPIYTFEADVLQNSTSLHNYRVHAPMQQRNPAADLRQHVAISMGEDELEYRQQKYDLH